MKLLSALILTAAGDAVTLPPPHGHLPHAHTHAPGEIDEKQGPLLLQATYTAEMIGNASGGVRRGTHYLDIIFEADMEKLIGWNGAQIHVYGLYNNGHSISDLVGDTQAVTNIATGSWTALIKDIRR